MAAIVVVAAAVWPSPGAVWAAEPAPGGGGEDGRHTRVVLLSWDGAPVWAVERMLADGVLPNLAALAQRGVMAAGMTPAFPSKTAVGHAAIFTGAWGDVNGVTGNLVPLLPRSEHTILERRSGYASVALTSEPFWRTAARAGRKVVSLSSTQSFPPEPHQEALRSAGVAQDRLVSFSGFEHLMSAERMVGAGALAVASPEWTGLPTHAGILREVELDVAGTPFFALVYDDPEDPVAGLDTVLVRQGSRDGKTAAAEAVIKPRPPGQQAEAWGRPFRVELDGLLGNAYFRVFDLAPDGSRLALYQRRVHGLGGTESREETSAYLDAYGGFHDDVFGGYQDGLLGPTVWQGGSGEAEERLLEIVWLDCHFLARGARYAWGRWQPDLLLHYSPMSDSAGHTWVGILDPESPAHDPALAARVWPYYERVFRHLDWWLGEVVTLVGPEVAVTVVSDHGMAGVGTFFSANAVLLEAGLLALDDEGRVDLARTKVLAPPWGDYYLAVNGTDWKGGVVPPEEREAVLAAATAALLAARDPESGVPLVTAVLRADRLTGLGVGGPAGGDLFLETAPGYYPSSRVTRRVTNPVRSAVGMGGHGFAPFRSSMTAIFALAGPGVTPGRRLPVIRQIDIAPTVLRLLGVTPAATVQGLPLPLS